MTSPEDDDLEQALRRALSAAAGEVEPAGDGLDAIRTRIAGRPPRPWLLSVFFGVLDRIRNWTWRGHWAWQESLPGLSALREQRSRRSNFPRWDIRWLRLVTVVGGVSVIACIALGVQPVRQAILQASTSLNGGGSAPRGGAGTGGNGTQGTLTTGSPAPSGGRAGASGTATVPGMSRGAGPYPTSSAECTTTTGTTATGTATTGTKQSPASEATDASAATAPAAKATTPPASATASVTASSTASGSASNVSTCPVTPAASTPTPTPTPATASSPAQPTTADESPTEAPVPTDTGLGQDPTPAPTPTATDTADDPSWPGPYRPPPRRDHGKSQGEQGQR